MSRLWGYSKRPKNWHKLLGEELTDEELDKAVIVAKYKESLSLPPESLSLPHDKIDMSKIEKPKIEKPKIEKPKISATVLRPVYSASPGSASPVYSASPGLALLALHDSSTSY